MRTWLTGVSFFHGTVWALGSLIRCNRERLVYTILSILFIGICRSVPAPESLAARAILRNEAGMSCVLNKTLTRLRQATRQQEDLVSQEGPRSRLFPPPLRRST